MCQRMLRECEYAQPTSSCVQTAPTSVAFEMLCFLMIDENLEVVKITFTVIAPWSRQDFFDIWVASLLLRHLVPTNLVGSSQ